MTPSERALLIEIYGAAVSAAHPDACLAPHLPPLPPEGSQLIILGAGKAAAAMAVTA